ncbi:hypothetical protein CRUP_037965 [Coryphaenoides rupestris]|nr:hypothetical protein CRUP_037965 [Coryphaenoides rupestris]
MSEPPCPHSEKLFSVARSLSGLGLDAANGVPSNFLGKNQDDDEEPPPPESGIELGPGLYFEDGRRKVDYVLCYKYKKRRGSKSRLSVASNGSIPPLGSGCQGSEAELGEAGLSAVEAEESKLTEEEKAVMRAEFETGLQEAGLNIERDTQKCELRERAGIAGIWDSLMSKVSQPFQPDVPELDIQRDAQTHVCSKTLKHPFIRDKLQLYDIKSTETLFDNATRSRIILHEEWANYGVMHKYQPVDLIRKYFGEQVGLYFAWLGVYTQLLIPPSLLGIVDRVQAKASVRMTVTTTAIILNMLVVLVLEEVYGAFAVWLTELELPKTEAEFEERLIFKSFFLKSMNAFAPIFYVAFFKGRFAGRPGDYVYIFGDYRMEEVRGGGGRCLVVIDCIMVLFPPAGCLIELCIQLSMIMLGKQLIQNNVFEVVIPKLKKMYRTMQEEKAKKLSAGRDEAEEEEPRRPKQQFDKDFALEPYEGVCPEYMEMIIQYGFVSLFVASFPLAPALALLNNVIEIRLDAAKFITEIRRPDAVRCKDIEPRAHSLDMSAWRSDTIFQSGSRIYLCDRLQAFVISFTSEFIPRMLYQYMYSVNGTMTGYTSTRSPTSTFKDYRDPPWAPDAYTFSKQYWSVLAARLAFVIFFQNLAMFLSMLVAWLIPDVPRSLREQLKKENMTLMEFLLNEEGTAKPGSPQHAAPWCCPTNIDIVVEAPQDEDVEDEDEEEEHRRTDEKEKEEEREEAWRKEEEERDEGEKEKKEEEEEEKKEEEVEAGVGVNVVGPAVTRNSDSELETSTKGEVEDEERAREGDGDGEEKANDEIVHLADGRAVVEMEEQVAAEREDEGGEGRPEEEKEMEEQHISIDLDLFMDQLGLLDDGDDDGLSSSKAREMELPRSDSRQQYPHLSELPDSPDPAPKQGSSYSLSDRVASTWAVAPDPMLRSLIGPPPKDVGSRGKARCFTLPSRPRVSQASYSLPRVNLSSSLSKLQQMASSIPLVPLCTPVAHSQLDPYSPPPTPRSLTPLQPESPPTQPESPPAQTESALQQPESPPAQAESALHQPESFQSHPRPNRSHRQPRQSQPYSSQSHHQPRQSQPYTSQSYPYHSQSQPQPSQTQPESPLAQPESPKPHLPSELFKLKGPPPQEPRSRARSRCSTLPARQRGPGAEDRGVKPSRSGGFTKQGDRIPPSPSELKRDSLL